MEKRIAPPLWGSPTRTFSSGYAGGTGTTSQAALAGLLKKPIDRRRRPALRGAIVGDHRDIAGVMHEMVPSLVPGAWVSLGRPNGKKEAILRSGRPLPLRSLGNARAATVVSDGPTHER